MPASELRRWLRAAVSGGCVISLTITGWTPALLAAELAQGRFNRGGGGGGSMQRPSARPGGGSSMQRPSARPGGGGSMQRPSARPGGAGAIGRPAPGFDRGNRRPPGGWVNSVPATRPRPLPGPVTRPALPPGGGVNRPVRPLPPGGGRPEGNRPGANRPDWNRPGRPGGNRPDWNRPGANRPDWNRPGRPGGNRPDWNRPGGSRPDWNRPGWNRPNWVVNRPVTINAIGVRPGWWGPGWAVSRPWTFGWFGGIPGTWGWWGPSSVAWGISSLASAAIIAAAINSAVRANSSTIPVVDSPYQLVFGSVVPVGDQSVTFSFLFEGQAFQASADCKRGLLNDRPPEQQEEAQLLNAACKVAFASF
jgi:hypothetical protein